MKLRFYSVPAALLAIVACTSTATSVNPGATPGAGQDGGVEGGEPGAIPDDGVDDPALQPPHSLGSIVLGELHSSDGDTAAPQVSATFVPDAMLTKSCKKKIEGGCEILSAPKCTNVRNSSTGCETNEYCSFDDSCAPVCKRQPICEEACASDEVCKVGSGDSAGTCVKVESFDAGPLAFSGTTTTITMFPPYRFETTGVGAPFLGGSEIHVQAQGAVEAGFEKFEEKFTATTFIQTSPSLAKISRSVVFGSGSIPIGWLPSTASTTDYVIVSVSGAGGSATCKVKDTVAKFDIPRSVVQAAQGDSDLGSSSSVSIAVTRQRKEIHKDKHAKGHLSSSTVQATGWLELVTRSTETTSFQSCPNGASFCGDTCVDLNDDSQNCGACGKVCSSGRTCSGGVCVAGTSCISCKSSTRSGACATQNNACELDIECSNLSNCVEQCTTPSCVSSCQTSYPTAVTKFANLKSCWDTQCAASCL